MRRVYRGKAVDEQDLEKEVVKKFILGEKTIGDYILLGIGILFITIAIYLLGDIIIGILLLGVGLGLVGNFFMKFW